MRLKIIHFGSPTCSICTTQDRILAEMKESYHIDFQSRLITTDFADALKFGVKSAPTLVYLLDDKAVAVRPGLQTKEKILSEIEYFR
jgi:predicted DsbA family dithiol-disulfide isomerase